MITLLLILMVAVGVMLLAIAAVILAVEEPSTWVEWTAFGGVLVIGLELIITSFVLSVIL